MGRARGPLRAVWLMIQNVRIGGQGTDRHTTGIKLTRIASLDRDLALDRNLTRDW
jgi:hypothetical protein